MKYQNLLSKNFHFLVVKFSAYLNRHVFVMENVPSVMCARQRLNILRNRNQSLIFSAWRNVASLDIQNALSEDSDQTAQMRRLIWIVNWRTYPKICFLILRLKIRIFGRQSRRQLNAIENGQKRWIAIPSQHMSPSVRMQTHLMKTHYSVVAVQYHEI